MDKSIWGERRPYVDALAALVEPGVSGPLVENSALVDLTMVTARTGQDASAHARAQAFLDLLQVAIARRLGPEEARIARILLALDEWTGIPAPARYAEVSRLRTSGQGRESYTREQFDADLWQIFSALLREAYSPAAGSPHKDAENEKLAEYSRQSISRLGRRRTAYPLDMSLGELHEAGLVIQPRLRKYHQRAADGGTHNVDALIDGLGRGESILLLGEPGSGKSLTMYELAVACRAHGLLPLPLRAVEAWDLVAQEEWRSLGNGQDANAVLLIDGLDEAIDQLTSDQQGFGSVLRQLLADRPSVISSRIREYEDITVAGLEEIGFDEVYVLEAWRADEQFRDYLARLTEADLVHEPHLYELVVASENLSSLVSRPLYARMLTFVGENSARGLPDPISLYGEYLTKLARVADGALRRDISQDAPSSLKVWQAAASLIYRSSADAGVMISLAKIEEELAVTVPAPLLRRTIDYIVDRRSVQGRDVGEFLHYSFYEYLVARQMSDELLGEPDAQDLAVILKDDLTREIRHYLTGQLKATPGATLKNTLLKSYASIRGALEIPESSRLSACNLLIYLVSRVISDSTIWLGQLFQDEADLFLQHALLWAMCHQGSRPALTRFYDLLERDPALREQCRGYVLYYYGDMGREAEPPFRDTDPYIPCPLSYKRVMDLFATADFSSDVAVERRYIDIYTLADVLGVRGIVVTQAQAGLLATVCESLREAGLPDIMMARLEEMTARLAHPR